MNIQQNTLIVIGGATATGKTALSIQLAQHFDAEILSADSRLFYKGMDIGTAKPTQEERAGIPHHFIDICAPCVPYSAGDYEREALDLLARLFQKNKIAIVVGGSGLFLRALTEGLDRFPEISATTKLEVEAIYAEYGLVGYLDVLKELDAAYFTRVDKQNPARLRRALEVCMETGQPYSSFLGQPKTPRPFRCISILLDMPRPILYDRINRRVDIMVEAGLEAEAKRFYPLRDCPSSKTVGYSEWFAHFDGDYDKAKAIDKIKQHTRNYAKRQGTWFRKHGAWQVFERNDLAPVLDYLNAELNILE